MNTKWLVQESKKYELESLIRREEKLVNLGRGEEGLYTRTGILGPSQPTRRCPTLSRLQASTRRDRKLRANEGN